MLYIGRCGINMNIYIYIHMYSILYIYMCVYIYMGRFLKGTHPTPLQWCLLHSHVSAKTRTCWLNIRQVAALCWSLHSRFSASNCFIECCGAKSQTTRALSARVRCKRRRLSRNSVARNSRNVTIVEELQMWVRS